MGKSSVVLPALVLDGLHYNILLGVNWLVYTKADLDLKIMNLKTEGEDIKIGAYPNPMAGFTAGKLKVYAVKLYWLEPGARMMLEIKHNSLSWRNMHVSGQRGQGISESRNPWKCVRRWEDRKLMVYKQTENHNKYTAQGTHWVSMEDIQ